MRFSKRTSFLVVIAFVLGLTVGAAWVAAQELNNPEHEAKILIKGLDGGDYEPYKASLITLVQEALKKEGSYSGEVSGTLDEATMDTLAEYQKKNGLQPSGVPSPKTRERLLEDGQP